MSCVSRGTAFAVVAVSVLTSALASAQTCIDTCNCARSASIAACDADYQTCVANAGGDPDQLALCAAQNADCLAAADADFIACARPCPVGNDPCGNCHLNFGFETTRCNDQYVACLQSGGAPATCSALFEACQAAAGQRFHDCLLSVCVHEPTCSCESAPCVSIAAAPVLRGCPAATLNVTGTVTNCSPVSADIDIFVGGVHVASHSGVAPGAVVSGSREVTNDCQLTSYSIRAEARTAGCSEAFVATSTLSIQCQCSDDCLTGRADITSLWPPSSQFVNVHVDALDAGGNPVAVNLTGVSSDEPSSVHCPDALLSFADASLRAARDPQRNGRVYRLSFVAREPQSAQCSGVVSVCVPVTRKGTCIDDGQLYDPQGCASKPLPVATAEPVLVRSGTDGGVEILVAESKGEGVRVDIYDVGGRRVAQLDDLVPQSGARRILWDGRDLRGRQVASGVYLVRVHLDGTVYSAKTVLLR